MVILKRSCKCWQWSLRWEILFSLCCFRCFIISYWFGKFYCNDTQKAFIADIPFFFFHFKKEREEEAFLLNLATIDEERNAIWEITCHWYRDAKSILITWITIDCETVLQDFRFVCFEQFAQLQFTPKHRNGNILQHS